MEILLFYKMEKKPGNKKESYLRMHSHEVWEHPSGAPLLGEHTRMGTSLRRTHLYGNLPYNFLFVEVAAQ
jgi:hypothetical protein